MGTAAAEPPRLTCRLDADPAAVAVGMAPVRLTLTNEGDEAVHVLAWNTPFEQAWLGTPFVVTRDAEELPYGGAMVKRGDPEADDYVTLAGGESASAVADLAAVYPLDRPGVYDVRWVGGFADVAPAGATLPRPRDAHRAVRLDCAPLRLELAAR